MKLAFVGIFIFAYLAFRTVSSQYIDVTYSVSPNEELMQGFYELGVSYITQKGTFESTKAPLPGLYYNLTAFEKIERRTTDAADHYRFVLLLTEQQNQATVRANFTIKYDYRNGTFLITNWRYNILKKSQPRRGFNAYTPIDVRPFNDGSSDELPVLKSRIQGFILDGIHRTVLPNSTYALDFIYGGYRDTWGERKVMFAKVVNAQDKIFRLAFEYYSPPETFPGEFSMIFENNPWYLPGWFDD